MVEPDQVDTEADYANQKESAAQALDRALRYWSNPRLSSRTRNELVSFGKRTDAAAVADWEKNAYKALRQNALRVLIATSPDQEAS
jgi:hypothetical protein